MYKKLIGFIFKITDAFNKEWHQNIERKVIEAGKELHTNKNTPIEIRDEENKKMREFYYTGMSNSSTLLIAISSFFVSVVALIVAILALM